MSVTGPGQFDPIYRVQGVDPDREDESRREQKRRVRYRGREWAEEDEELPFEPSLPSGHPPADNPSAKRRTKSSLYADQVLLDNAQSLFDSMTTLEEKIGQLFFLQTEAYYDPAIQNAISLMIQQSQIGGVVFSSGEYKRQAYLIESFQKLSKTPLLFGNDFLHGLSFYFQGELPDNPFEGDESLRRFKDIGKTVMVQNRHLGVHFQFDRERLHDDPRLTMNEEQCKSFRKGIRDAYGIVAREHAYCHPTLGTSSMKKNVTLQSLTLKPVIQESNILETIGMKTLDFYDLVHLPKEDEISIQLLKAFSEGHDLFLLSHSIPEAIKTLAQAVREGHISEKEIERRVMKVLIIKSLFFA